MIVRCGRTSSIRDQRGAPRALGVGGSSCRAGFTLFELLLVLAILLAVAMSITPALMQRMKEDRLRQGEEGVAALIRGARVHALQSGVPYQFRFETGGTRYVALPFDADAVQPVVVTPGTVAPPTCWKHSGTLPKSVNFVAETIFGAPAQGLPQDWLAGLDDAQALSQVNWSAPILFQPDGTSSGGLIELTNGRTTRWLAVRQLTGEALGMTAGDTATLANQGVTP